MDCEGSRVSLKLFDSRVELQVRPVCMDLQANKAVLGGQVW
jgi:hypothetical protein